MKYKKGFTLIELLIVISLIAVLTSIVLLNVVKVYKQSKKNTFLSEVRIIYKESQKVFLSEKIKGNIIKTISSSEDDLLQLNNKNMDYCVVFDETGNILSIRISNGKYYVDYDDIDIYTIDLKDINEGKINLNSCKKINVNNCIYNGELSQGATYVNGQYTYRYKKEKVSSGANSTDEASWNNILADGWGVVLSDKLSTETVNTPLCTSINGKPIVSMSLMFYESKAQNIDLSNFNTSHVENMWGMFANTSANSLDLSSFDTLKTVDMHSMFYESKATEIKGLDKLNTINVNDMKQMFQRSSASTLNLSNWNTSKVLDMSYMFADSKAEQINIKSFDTSNVSNMKNMFWGTNINKLDLNNFDTSHTEDMSAMFYKTKISELNLSSFDTSKVLDMSYMFAESNLSKIYTGKKWNVSSVSSDGSMFDSAIYLVGEKGTKYDLSNPTNKTYAHIDGGSNNPGYFTSK